MYVRERSGIGERRLMGRKQGIQGSKGQQYVRLEKVVDTNNIL